MKSPALILAIIWLLVSSAFAEEKVGLYQATRARDASLAVHKTVMQRIFGITVSYSGVLVPKSKQRRLAILANDTPVIMAVTFVFACLVVVFNLLADIIYGWLDPRISYR